MMHEIKSVLRSRNGKYFFLAVGGVLSSVSVVSLAVHVVSSLAVSSKVETGGLRSGLWSVPRRWTMDLVPHGTTTHFQSA